MVNEREVLDECRRLNKDDLHEEAVNLLSQAITVSPSHTLFYQRGKQYENLGELGKALDDFSSALQFEPNEKRYLESRGVLLSSRLGRVADSLSDFDRVASLDPFSPVPHQHLSLCHLQLGNLDAAFDHAERAISLNDSNGYSHYCLAQCRLAGDRFHSAAKEFEIASKLEPNNARFLMGLSAACAGMGELDKAEICCQKAINLDASATAYIQLARIQLNRANPQRAIESLEMAITFDLEDAEKALVDGYLEIARQY